MLQCPADFDVLVKPQNNLSSFKKYSNESAHAIIWRWIRLYHLCTILNEPVPVVSFRRILSQSDAAVKVDVGACLGIGGGEGLYFECIQNDTLVPTPYKTNYLL